MKNSIHLALLASLFLSTAALNASDYDVEESDCFSFEQINPQTAVFTPPFYQDDQWLIWKGSWNNEDFQISLPSNPKSIQKKDDRLGISTKDDSNVSYSLVVSKHKSKAEYEEENKKDKNGAKKFFDDMEKYIACISRQFVEDYKLISSQESETDLGKILDVCVYHKITKIYVKHRILTTDSNFFILSTYFRESEPENHSYFVDSFSILKKTSTPNEPIKAL